MPDDEGPLDRVLSLLDAPDLVDQLSSLTGADMTTLQLALSRVRAAKRTPADVLRAYERDRFVSPSPIEGRRLHAVEGVLLRALPAEIAAVELSPVLPLASHSGLSSVPQNNVLTTIRATEVSGDPAGGLALEAAVRRRALLRVDPRSNVSIELAGCQRAIRAQPFQGPVSFAHFAIFAVASAGRNERGLPFERAAAVRHVLFHARGALAAGVDAVEIRLSDLSDDGRDSPILDAVRAALAGESHITVLDDPDREHGRGYYPGFCFKVHATREDSTSEIGDGGFVNWTQLLLSDRKERLLTTGTSVDRLTLLSHPFSE
jgi:hypothetical protein